VPTARVKASCKQSSCRKLKTPCDRLQTKSRACWEAVAAVNTAHKLSDPTGVQNAMALGS